MNTLLNILGDAVYFVGTFYIALIVLRVLLQFVRADFYNPISKGIVTFTNPVLVPFRKFIPGLFGLDLASIFVALILQMLVLFLVTLLKGPSLINLFILLPWAIYEILNFVIMIYFWGVIILAIVSWIAPHNYNPALSLLQQIIEPVLRPIRKLLPPMSGFDLSPMILCFILLMLQKYALPALAGLFWIPHY